MATPITAAMSALRSLFHPNRDRQDPAHGSGRAQRRLSNQKTAAHFDEVADRYAGFYAGDTPLAYFFSTRQEIICNLLEESPRAGRVIDLGCGPGLMAKCFAKKGMEYSGVDISPEMIAQCQLNESGEGVRFSVGKLERLRFPDEHFDLALAIGVLEYVPRLSDALDEIRRVTRADGQVVFSCLNQLSPYWFWVRWVHGPCVALVSRLRGRTVDPPPPLRLFRQRSFRRMLKSRGLVVTDVVYFSYTPLVPPLDKRFPGHRAVRICSWLEHRLRNSAVRWLGQAFVLAARRQTVPGPTGTVPSPKASPAFAESAASAHQIGTPPARPNDPPGPGSRPDSQDALASARSAVPWL